MHTQRGHPDSKQKRLKPGYFLSVAEVQTMTPPRSPKEFHWESFSKQKWHRGMKMVKVHECVHT